MKSFKHFQEDIEISGKKYNDMVSKRQMRDKKDDRKEVDTEFNKSDKLERMKMRKTRRKVYEDYDSPFSADKFKNKVQSKLDSKEAAREAAKEREEEKEQMKKEIKRELGVREVYDPEVQGRSQIRKTGEGGMVGRDRKKSEPEKRRMKAVGGGKTAPVEYKRRSDVGKQRQSSDRVQAPTKERGSAEVKQSYADKVKAERKKAAQARIAAKKSGEQVKKTTTSKKETEKQASKLLSTKKPEKKVDPGYKPQKASGYTRQERMKITRKGETMLKGIMKDQENAKYKKETGRSPDSEAKRKVIIPRVQRRMST